MTEQEYINEQIKLSAQIQLDNTVILPQVHSVAGVDLAYWKEEDGQEYAVCCIVVIDYHTKAVLESVSHADIINVPYIPGCLAFRESHSFCKHTKKSPSCRMSSFLTAMAICIQGIWGWQHTRVF